MRKVVSMWKEIKDEYPYTHKLVTLARMEGVIIGAAFASAVCLVLVYLKG